MVHLRFASKIKKRSRSGASLITVILIGLLLTVVALVSLTAATQTSSRSVQERGSAAAFQVADSASEYIRNIYIQEFKASGSTAATWVSNILTGTYTPALGSAYTAFFAINAANPQTTGTGAINLDPNYAQTYKSPQNIGNTSISGISRVRAKVALDSSNQNFVIYVTATMDDGSEQTVVKGFTGASTTSFKLAMMSRTTSCTFCHLSIQGDLGSLSHFRPGWNIKTACTDIGWNELTHVQGTGTYGCSTNGDGNTSEGDTEFSSIAGNVYAYQKITDDSTSATTNTTYTMSGNVSINNVSVSGTAQRQAASASVFGVLAATPDINGNGQKDDFPPITKVAAKATATATGGSLTVSTVNPADPATINIYSATQRGAIYVVPAGITYNPANTSTYAVSSLANANGTGTLILVGTLNDPIVLNKSFFFDGDIILKGYVSGQADITAGRNIFIAGEVIYKNPPGTNISCSIGATTSCGNYVGSSNPTADAITSAQLAKDSLRLYAVANIVLGDYTTDTYSPTTPATLTPSPLVRENQQSDYMKSQFSLNGTDNIYYDKATGQELIKVVDNSNNVTQLRSQTGKVLALPTSVSAAPSDFTGVGDYNTSNISYQTSANYYNYAFKPGFVNASTGAFTSSMSDLNYRNLLGTDSITDNSWRIDINNTFLNASYPSLGGTSDSLANYCKSSISSSSVCYKYLQDNFYQQFNNGGSPGLQSTFLANLAATIQNAAKGSSCTDSCQAFDSNSSSSTAGAYYAWDGGNFIRVLDKGTLLTPNQIERVDAYLYTNNRLGGKISGTNLTINGGFTAQNFGILAPGVGDEQTYWTTGSINSYIAGQKNIRNTKNGAIYNTGLQVNYDYRLQNFVTPFAGPVGSITYFRLGTASDRVN